MQFLDVEALNAIGQREFQDAKPYPWVNPQHLVTAEGWKALTSNLPDPAIFDSFEGKERKYGQKSTPRLSLEWQEGLALPEPWERFMEEVCSETYHAFVGKLLGQRHFGFRFHWNYTPRGSDVPPHCDSKTKLGSHIFYLNTEQDWRAEWGGETVILDDGGSLSTGSNPGFEEFDQAWPAETLDNRSLIFGRRGNSWHGVRELVCPEGASRKVFIIVFEDTRIGRRVRKNALRLLKGKPLAPLRDPAVYHLE